MEKQDKIICDFMHKFVDEHWDKIDLKKVEINDSKATFLRKVKKDVQLALWVYGEVAAWGMDMVYLADLSVFREDETDFFNVIKIGDKYIKLKIETKTYNYLTSFTEPKTRTITYFD